MEAQAALVRANGGVELDAVAAVHLNLALVVNPGHAELDGALRLDDALQHTGLLVLRVLLDNRLQGLEDLANGLQELRLIAVTGNDLVVDTLDVLVSEHDSP